MSLADEYKRTVRREQVRFPLRTRWTLVTLRLMHAPTWRDRWRNVRWQDLVYLLRG